MLSQCLCDYSDQVCITYLLKELYISVTNVGAADIYCKNTDIKVIFKKCDPFTHCISEINNAQVNNAKYLGVVMTIVQFNAIQC